VRCGSTGRAASGRQNRFVSLALNAALPGADREVYRTAGKTDVSVRADYVDDGLGPGVDLPVRQQDLE
jgi:hypothetical protein